MTPVGRLSFLGSWSPHRTHAIAIDESARSANLRAIGALGAAKRPLQLP